LPASQDGEFLWGRGKRDLHRGTSVKLTDGCRQDYRQRNTFLSTFWPVPGTVQPHVRLYKILKSRENRTLPQRTHSFRGDNLATIFHLLQVSHVPNKTKFIKLNRLHTRNEKAKKVGCNVARPYNPCVVQTTGRMSPTRLCFVVRGHICKLRMYYKKVQHFRRLVRLFTRSAGGPAHNGGCGPLPNKRL